MDANAKNTAADQQGNAIQKRSQPQQYSAGIGNLIPSDDKPDAVGTTIAQITKEILDFRDDLGLPKKWNRFNNLRKSKMWKQDKAPDGTVLQSVNMLAPHIQRTVNMLTANNPTFDVVHIGQTSEDTEQILEIINATIEDYWQEEEQQSVFEESCFIGEESGSVAEKASFNLHKNFPEGEVEFESIHPFYYGMYPIRTRRAEKAEAFLHFYPKSVLEAQRMWPDRKEDIVADSTLLEDIDDTRETSLSSMPSTHKVMQYFQDFQSSSQKSGGSGVEETWIIECWVKDYTQDEAGQPKYTGNIRRIRACCGGSVILDDMDNPSINPELPDEAKQKSYLFSRFPFSHTQSNTDPSSPFGLSDFQQLEQLNAGLNKAVTQYNKFKDDASHLKMKNPRNSGVPDDDFTNSSGILHPINHVVAQAIGYVNPPVMSSDIPTAITMYESFFDKVAGSFSDVMQGQKSGSSVVSAKAIALLLEQASLMMQGKLHNYTKMIRERGRMYKSLASNFYSDDKWITIHDHGQKKPVQVTRQLLLQPVRLAVVSGSTMPVSRIQVREEALSLLKAGAIDQEEVLRVFDIPNRHQILQRMRTPLIQQWLQKLQMIGVPDGLLKLFGQIAALEPDKIQKALQDKQIPAFPEILQKMIQAAQQGGQQQEQQKAQQIQQIQEKAAIKEIQLKLAEQEAKVKEIEAKTLLLQEQAKSEQVDQEIKARGVGFDEEKLKMVRAETISKLKNTEHKEKQEHYKLASDIAERSEKAKAWQKQSYPNIKTGGMEYNEQGLKSNNQTIEPQ